MKTTSATAAQRPELHWVSVPDGFGKSHLEMIWVIPQAVEHDVPVQLPAAA